MPVSVLNHRYLGQKSLVSFEKQNILDQLYNHLTAPNYADGSLRSAGPSNWTWEQKDGNAAIYGNPAVNSSDVGHRVVIALTDSTQPTGVTFRNGFIPNSIVIGLVKDVGASPSYLSWNSSTGNPLDSGSFSGYITAFNNIDTIGTINNFKWLAWESQQTIWIQTFYNIQGVSQNFSKLLFAGATTDPLTGDGLDAELDGVQYTVCGMGNSTLAGDTLSSVIDSANLLTSSNTNNLPRWLAFSPQTASMVHCMRVFNIPSQFNEAGFTSRAGKYPRLPIYHSNCSDLASGPHTPTSWGGKLREVFFVKHSLSGQVLMDGLVPAGYTIAVNLTGLPEDALFLKY